MDSLPTGTVVFLFADVEGSTLLAQQLGDRYAELQNTCHRLVRAAVEEQAGRVVSVQGDGLFAVFLHPRDAVRAAVAAQQALATYSWPQDSRLRVRMGLHTGEGRLTETGYMGVDVNYAARIGLIGYGGQILVSAATHGLVAAELDEGVALRDLGPIRVKDFVEPLRLFQVVAAELADDFPTLKSAATTQNNLPRQLTSFIGREQEISEVQQLLSDACLVTLTGSGGVGKTRLALQVAAGLLDRYPDGVWLVEFASLADPEFVPQTVAVALSIREEPSRPLIATLADFARTRNMLVILDNCEHLLGACAKLTEALLRYCPNLRVLATSREALGIRGEMVWRIPSLSLPDLRYPQPLERAAACEAVRLFVARAALTNAKFTLTASNAAAVTEVCTRLDGIPLAIELAAARTDILTIQQIAARLQDRFRFLTGGHRTDLPRQQTLKAMMDWSYDLLTEKERSLWRRLSVFAGGWTIEAAEAVCSDGEDAAEVLGLLAQLVSKSLVIMDAQQEQARYRMLETVRRYGRDRLDESAEYERVRIRHMNWYLSFAESTEPKLRGVDQSVWLNRLEEEHDNLRTALESSKTQEDDRGLRLARALWQFWHIRGYFSEGRRWLETMLAHSQAPALIRAQALVGAGYLAHRQDDYDGATRLCTQSLALFRTVGDLSGMARSLYVLGQVAEYQGHYDSAKNLFAESLALGRQAGDKQRMAVALNSIGEVARCQRDFGAARVSYDESLSLAREIGDMRAVTMALGNLGHVALHERDLDRAVALFSEALRLAQQLIHKIAIAEYLAGIAGVAVSTAQHERAARLLGAARDLLDHIGTSLAPPDEIEFKFTTDAVRSALSEVSFRRAWEAGRSMLLEEAIEYALTVPSS